jgi:dipeptidyl aminopeptidase/acylaminoacyl peptidase
MRFRTLSAAALTVVAPALAASQQRPITVDDLLTLSAFAEVAISPDGEVVAATVIRPGSSSRFGCILCNYHSAADIWLVNRRSGERRNLTRGAADSSSAWLPTWSPDGRRLAFVSTRAERGERRGGNVRPYVWERDRVTPRRLSDRDVHLQVDITTARGVTRSLAWLDDTSLVVPFLPRGISADEQVLPWRKGVREASRAWARWEAGQPTGSVLESPVPDTFATQMVTLARIGARSGTSREVADIPNWDLWDLNSNLQVSISPDGRRAAVVTIAGLMEQRADRLLPNSVWKNRVAIARLDRVAPLTWAPESPWGQGTEAQLLPWSPDGRAFVVLQLVEAGTPRQRQVALLVSAAGAMQASPGNLAIGDVLWTADGRLIARARTLAPDTGTQRRPGRWDWFRADSGWSLSNITASMPASPSRVVRTAAADKLVGLADGALWLVSTNREAPSPKRLTGAEFAGRSSIVESRSDSADATLVIQTTRDGSRALAHLSVRPLGDSARVETAPIPIPSATARLIAASHRADAFAFSDDTPGGIQLWSARPGAAAATRLMVLNEHVAGLAQARRLLFWYRAQDGDSLRGLALLPPDFRSDRRYPLAVWAYGGYVVTDTMVPRAGKNYSGTFNMEVLAAHGYVVLFPSIPLPYGVRADVWSEIPKGVLPAIDRLIELGVADSARLAVLGHSFGGYSAYALVTQTNRFKAAVAMSGHPDLLSLYGQFLPGERYSDRAHQGMVTASMFESGPFDMAAPLAEDPWRYLRNSPLLYMDRVRTPLMIVHGDMDGAPIQQGEEAFTTLTRMGRKARFVRYWGEGHVVASPPNVRHLWGQIFDWLDTNVKPAAAR